MSIEVRPYKGKKEVWEYDIRVRLPTGKEIRERKKSPVSGKEATKRWAAARERELYEQAVSGELLKRKEIPPMENYWPIYRQSLVALGRRHATLRLRDTHARTWVLPHLGNLRLDQVGGQEIANLTTKMVEAGRGSSTILGVLALVGGMLELAKKRGKIDMVPEFEHPKSVALKERAIVPPEMFEEVVNSARMFGPEALAIILLTGEMALRSGEVMGLWWDCVDFEVGKITVRRNLYDGVLGPPKSGKRRTFKATPRTLAALRALPRNRLDFIFVREGGDVHTRASYDAIIERVLRQVGLDLNPHALRHHALTRMALAGVPPHVIRQISGHQDLQILQTYLHDDVEDTQIAVDRLAGGRSHPGSAPGDIQEKPHEGRILEFRRTP